MTDSSSGIAIIGMAGRFPGARGLARFWKNVRGGVESIRFFTPEELKAAGVPAERLRDPAFVPAAGWLDDIDKFDAGFFGLSARDAQVFDPQHRFFLEVAWEAFENAGYVPDAIPGATGVFAASGMSSYLIFNLLRNPQAVETVGEWLLRHTGNDPDFLATRVSYELDLKGPSLSVQTACSSSLVAVHLACQSLLQGECDLALAGGSTIDPRQAQGYLYREGEILAPDGHCRPFDAAAKGTVNASATAAVVLKRLDHALRDRDCIRAVILGSAVNNDGAQKAGYLAPSVEGQARAVSEALGVAGVAPEQISYIEAHGTGTLLGDPIELSALQQVFQGAAGARVALGSVKGNLGHAGETASIVGLLKTVLALEHRELPPMVHFRRPNPQARLDGKPFYVPAQLTPWESAGRRRAGVTGLGAGGTNAHVVLEEAPPVEPAPPPPRAAQLLVVSARSSEAADRACEQLADHLDEARPDLADVAFTLASGRKAFPHRRAVVAPGADSAARALREPARLSAEAAANASVAFLYPGGGAQYPQMGAGLYQAERVYREAIDECVAAHPAVRGALFSNEASAAPSLALPALFAVEYAMTKLLGSFGVRPAAVLGHSAGEYAAACAAGVLSARDALGLVALRGQLFETLPRGGMLSVSLSESELRARLPAGLAIAAVNGPQLSVASGPVEPLAELEAALSREGVQCARVHIEVAAHSAMLDPILPAFAARCRATRFAAPAVPYLSNLTGTWATSEVADPDYWVRHLRQPVRFGPALAAALAQPGRLLLEVGPGRTLASLARQAQGAAQVTFRHPKEPADDVEVVLGALGWLWTRGVEPAWPALSGDQRRRVPLPAYPFEQQRHWIDPAPEQPAKASLRKRPDVAEWFSVPAWSRAAPAADHEPHDQGWLVIDDGGPLAEEVARRLGERAVRLRLGSTPDPGRRIRPGLRQDVVAAFDALRAKGRWPRTVLYLPGTGPRPRRSDAAFRAAFAQYETLVFIAQQLAAEELPAVLVVATEGAQGVTGEAVRAPERALLAGAARVIPHELPHLRVVAVDAGPADGARLLAEAGSGESEPLVALRPGARFLHRLAPLPLPRAPRPWLRDGESLVITGGAGALGACVAAHAARSCAGARIALLSRRAPDEAQLAALRALGAEALALRADAGDRASLRTALRQVRARFGAIGCVVHAAGLLNDVPIAARGDDTGRQVIAAKARAALQLAEQLDPSTRLVLFSSVSSLLGLPGQIDYSAANGVLDALAQARPNTVSLGFGAWQEIGLAATGGSVRAGDDVRAVRLRRDRDWVVGDHVIRGGEAVIPGTGVADLFVRALDAPRVELRNLTFLAPFVVPLGVERIVRTRRRGDELALLDGPDVCATAFVRELDGSRPRAVDLGAVRRRCATRVLDRFEQHLVDFGPRWSCLERLALGKNEALVDLALDPRFVADLEAHPLHPALLDLATGSAQALREGFDASRDFFVPFSYARLAVHAPLEPRLVSHVRLREGTADDELVFDATVCTPQGTPLVELEGYTLRRVGVRAFGARKEERWSPLREGIAPSEGLDAIDRVLSSMPAPHLYVSPVDLSAWQARVDEAGRPVRPADAAPAGPQAAADAPQTEVEREVAALFREFLGVARPRRRDNFFELGGESLIAVRMSMRLQRKFGVELPLAALFEAPTLEACAARIDAARGLAAGPEVKELRPALRHLVQIQPGEAARTPFFCVHGAGGNVLNLRDLARGLDPALPFIGLQARGVDGKEPPHQTIEAAASAYLAEIRQRQPAGPYLLGGYSGGGVLAYELAQQLTAAGEQVALLAFIDSFSPLMRVGPPSMRNRLARLRDERFGYFRSWLLRKRAGRHDRREEGRLQEILQAGGMVPADLRDRYLFASFGRLVEQYRAKPWSGSAILFRATTNYWFSGAGPDYGWDVLMPGRVQVVPCPGDHSNLLLGENAAVLIEALGRAIAEAGGSGVEGTASSSVA